MLISLAGETEGTNPDSSLLLSKQALTSSQSINWKMGIIKSLTSIGIYYDMKGEVNTAFTFEDSALILSNRYNIKGVLGSIYNILGNITSDENDYAKGLDYYFKALAIDSITSKNAAAQVCNNLGIDYEELGDYLKAEEFYLRALKVYEDENNAEGNATILENLGNLYNLQNDYQKGLSNLMKAESIDSSLGNQQSLVIDLANIGEGYLSLKDYAKSLEYTFKSIYLGKKISVLSDLHTAYSNIGEAFIDIFRDDSTAKGFVYMMNGNILYVKHNAILDSALVYEQLSIARANIVHNELSLTHAIRGIGQIYTLKKDYKNAITNCQRAYKLADSLGVLQEKMDNAQILGHALVQAGNYSTAITYLDIANNLKDTIYSKEKNKQIAELEVRYQNEKKKKEIEELAQKNEIQNLQIDQNRYFIIGLAGLVVLIIAIALLLMRQNRINALHAKIELEQKLLRSQMNPHFIFNAMTSVQNYIYKEQPQEAANYLSSVFKLMRSILESSKEEYIVVEKEIQTLKHYLILQQLCYHNKFDFSIDVDPKLDVDNITIPPMMAQPFIENAIEHGIVNKEGAKGIITVRLKMLNDMFSLEIEDNGVGREKAKEINTANSGKHLSVATNITEDRILLLNKKSKNKISMQIVDLKDENNKGAGTKVIFYFPINTLV